MDKQSRSFISVSLFVVAGFLLAHVIIRKLGLDRVGLPLVLFVIGILIWLWDRLQVILQGSNRNPDVDAVAPAVKETSPAKMGLMSETAALADENQHLTLTGGDVGEMLHEAHSPLADEAQHYKLRTVDRGDFSDAREIEGADFGSAPRDVLQTATMPVVSDAADAAPEAEAEAPAPVVPVVTRAASHPRQPDDLTVVEGIGPKMNAALLAAGITTFEELAQASLATIQAAIEAAGMRFAPSAPTWAEQSAFAARGDWEGLARFQEQLVAGRRPK